MGPGQRGRARPGHDLYDMIIKPKSKDRYRSKRGEKKRANKAKWDRGHQGMLADVHPVAEPTECTDPIQDPEKHPDPTLDPAPPHAEGVRESSRGSKGFGKVVGM